MSKSLLKKRNRDTEDDQIECYLNFQRNLLPENLIPNDGLLGYYCEMENKCCIHDCEERVNYIGKNKRLYCGLHFNKQLGGQAIHLCKYCFSCDMCFYWKKSDQEKIENLKHCPILTHLGNDRNLSDMFWVKEDPQIINYYSDEFIKINYDSWWSRKSKEVKITDLRSNLFYKHLDKLKNKNNFNEEFALNYSKFYVKCQNWYECDNSTNLRFYQQGAAYKTCPRCQANYCIDCQKSDYCQACKKFGNLPASNFMCSICHKTDLKPCELLDTYTIICHQEGCKSLVCHDCFYNNSMHESSSEITCAYCRSKAVITNFAIINKLFETTEVITVLNKEENFDELFNLLFKNK